MYSQQEPKGAGHFNTGLWSQQYHGEPLLAFIVYSVRPRPAWQLPQGKPSTRERQTCDRTYWRNSGEMWLIRSRWPAAQRRLTAVLWERGVSERETSGCWILQAPSEHHNEYWSPSLFCVGIREQNRVTSRPMTHVCPTELRRDSVLLTSLATRALTSPF